MKLPAYYEALEAEALAFARECLAASQEDGDFLGLGCGPLDPEAGRRFVRRMMARWTSYADDTAMFWLVEVALAGWQDAIVVVNGLIDAHVNRHEPLPSYLAYYDTKIRAGYRAPKPRGRKISADFMQDVVLMTLMMELVARFGLQISRKQIGRKRQPSACSIVATAATEIGLHRGDEEGMRNIWREYEPRLVPGWRFAPPRLIKKYQ